MAGAVAALPKFKFTSAAGVPLANGSVEVYVAGSTTPVNTYQDSALTVQNTWPITLDANGECLMWLDDSKLYKFVLKNAGTAQQWSIDNVPAGSAAFTQSGTGSVSRAVQDRLRDTISVLDFMTSAQRSDVTGFVGSLDLSTAIVSALARAHSIGAVLEFPAGLYCYSQTITLQAGDKIQGAGWGNNPLGAGSTNSSILWYSGAAEAVKLYGFLAECIGFCLKDKNKTATHAVRVLADTANLIESPRVDVYVNGFTGSGAYAFTCEATSGAIAYGDFRVRARSCANYFKIQDNNDGRAAPFGFCNSNTYLLQASGGETGAQAPGYALYVDGGNNNYIEPGSVLEPYQTTGNHVKALRGSLSGWLRVEGQQQSSTIPLVDLASGVEGTLKIDPSAAFVINRSRSADLENRGAKAAQPRNPAHNLYKNPQFFQNRDGNIADWNVTGAGVTVTTLDPDFMPGFRTLRVVVPAGIAATLAQAVAVLNTDFAYVSHGFWVKYDIATYPGGSVTVSTFTSTGTAGTFLHTGDNTYQFLGQSVKWGTQSNTINRLNLNGGSGGATFYVTCPMFCFGTELPMLAPQQYEGVAREIVLDLANVWGGTTELTLPTTGDLFLITTTVGIKTIDRINKTSNFRSVGQVVRLMFDATSAGSTISVASANIIGRANIVTDQYSVVTLVQDKAGLWRIVSNY